MPDEMSAKDLVLLEYPEAHTFPVEDGEYIILSNKTEDALQLGYFEKTEEEAWESALAFIDEVAAANADLGEFDEDEDEEEDEED